MLRATLGGEDGLAGLPVELVDLLGPLGVRQDVLHEVAAVVETGRWSGRARGGDAV